MYLLLQQVYDRYYIRQSDTYPIFVVHTLPTQRLYISNGRHNHGRYDEVLSTHIGACILMASIHRDQLCVMRRQLRNIKVSRN